MLKQLLQSDLKNLPKILFLLVLLFYPLIGYIATKPLKMDAVNALGLICVCFLIYKFFEIYITGSNLVIPLYVTLYGLFAIYTLFCGIFITDYFSQRGIKFFYSDPIWMTFMAFIIVENVYFSNKFLKLGQNVLRITLIVAAVVSLIQVVNPLFLVNDQFFIKGLSYERMENYYATGNHGLSQASVGSVGRFMDGYRLSIFSYINERSIGIDAIAIFSILVAWRPIHLINRSVVTLSAILISFLSSSRWIILGLIVVASQILWLSKNKLTNFLYFILGTISFLVILVLVAHFIGFDVENYIEQRLLAESALTRILAFEVFFEVFPNNPIFGTGGADTAEMVRLLGGKSSQIHVGFLKLFYYYGMIGGILFLSFMVAFLIRLRKMAKYCGYWGGFFAILAFFVANLTLFELSLFYYGPLLAIIFANHFYSKKLEDATLDTGSVASLTLN